MIKWHLNSPYQKQSFSATWEEIEFGPYPSKNLPAPHTSPSQVGKNERWKWARYGGFWLWPQHLGGGTLAWLPSKFEANPDFMIPLPKPPECLDYRGAPPRQSNRFVFISKPPPDVWHESQALGKHLTTKSISAHKSLGMAFTCFSHSVCDVCSRLQRGKAPKMKTKQ